MEFNLNNLNRKYKSVAIVVDIVCVFVATRFRTHKLSYLLSFPDGSWSPSDGGSIDCNGAALATVTDRMRGLRAPDKLSERLHRRRIEQFERSV